MINKKIASEENQEEMDPKMTSEENEMDLDYEETPDFGKTGVKLSIDDDSNQIKVFLSKDAIPIHLELEDGYLINRSLKDYNENVFPDGTNEIFDIFEFFSGDVNEAVKYLKNFSLGESPETKEVEQFNLSSEGEKSPEEEKNIESVE